LYGGGVLPAQYYPCDRSDCCVCVTSRDGKSGMLRVDGRTVGTVESPGSLTSLETSGSVFVGQLLHLSGCLSIRLRSKPNVESNVAWLT